MTRFLRQCLALARRDLALQRSYGVSALLGLASGLLGLLSYHFIGRLVGDESVLVGRGYFPFVCTGLMVQLLVTAVLGALGGALPREAQEGTLEPALAAGASPLALLAGATLVPLLLALAQAVLYAVGGAAIFGLSFAGAHPGPALLALGLTVLASAPVGLVAAAAWLRWRRPGLVTTAAVFAFGFLGGVYFPVALLPGPLAALAAWLPLSVGLAAVRDALLEGAGYGATAPALARLALLAALGLPPAAALFDLALRRALRRGTLSLT